MGKVKVQGSGKAQVQAKAPAAVSPNGPANVQALVATHTAARAAYVAAGGCWAKGQPADLAALGKALLQARNALRAAHGGKPIRQVYAELGIQPVYRTRNSK